MRAGGDGLRPEKGVAFRDVWTQRSLADALLLRRGICVSRSTVQRKLHARGMRPHRVRQWLHSPDPEFRPKVQRVCDLYPGQHAQPEVVWHVRVWEMHESPHGWPDLHTLQQPPGGGFGPAVQGVSAVAVRNGRLGRGWVRQGHSSSTLQCLDRQDRMHSTAFAATPDLLLGVALAMSSRKRPRCGA
jgi:hypothetical protein